MKRWTLLLGRIGTTIIVIGLALFLVSLIPPMEIQASFSIFPGPTIISSKTWVTDYEGFLTGLQTVRLTVTTNGTLDVYVFKISSEEIYQWINRTYSWSMVNNATGLDEFLGSHPASVVWQGEVSNGTISAKWGPTSITNVTMVVSNRSPDDVTANYDWAQFSSVAPVSKVHVLSAFAIPIGFVFTLPWLSNLLKSRKRLLMRT
jgi:hypothetical protein